MTNRRAYDRTVRTVMWLDAFLSLAMVMAMLIVAILAVPIVASLGIPHVVVRAFGIAAIVCAVLLAAFGAITAVALMMRMHRGDFLLPGDLRLPLPAAMRPAGVLPHRVDQANSV